MPDDRRTPQRSRASLHLLGFWALGRRLLGLRSRLGLRRLLVGGGLDELLRFGRFGRQRRAFGNDDGSHAANLRMKWMKWCNSIWTEKNQPKSTRKKPPSVAS